MAVTEEQLGSPAVEALSREATPEALSERPSEPGIDLWARWTRVLLIAWLAGFGGLLAFEPVPDGASVPTWAAAISLAFLTSLGTTLVGLATRRPWALRASAVTAGAGVILAAACAQTGHHAGAWWAVELAVFGALLGMTRMARTGTAETR
jgi:hypothetical protein